MLGGVVGGLVGLAAGPVGALVVGGLGALAGSAKDEDDELTGTTMISRASGNLRNGELAVITLAREKTENALDALLRQYAVKILREDAAKAREELRQAEKEAIKRDLTS